MTNEEFKDELYRMKNFESVSEEEYAKFIEEYPRELHPHSICFCTPPIHGMYDFALNPFDGDATCCMVAEKFNVWKSPEYEYRIVTNIPEILAFIEKCTTEIDTVGGAQ